MLKAKQARCLVASWLVSFVLCLGDQRICFADFMIDIHQWGQSKGSSNSKYKGVSISYHPDLFLTDRYSQYILCVG